MESSILNKIEHVKMRLTGGSTCGAISGSTAELREDLDQAMTQIGMTESLLNALSPSDSLEIFTKLEVLASYFSSVAQIYFTHFWWSYSFEINTNNYLKKMNA